MNQTLTVTSPDLCPEIRSDSLPLVFLTQKHLTDALSDQKSTE